MLAESKQNQLQTFSTEDGIEIVIDMATGETWATERGYARMSGKSQQAINKRGKTGNNQDKVVKVEMLTNGGLQGNNLIPESTILLWLEKDNPSLLTKFAQLGLRSTLHKWAGVDFSEKEPEPDQKSLEAEDKVRLAKMCADFWQELGLYDERDRLFLKDFTQNAIAQSDQKYLEQAQDSEIAISNRVVELGYKADHTTLKKIGQKIAKEYKKLKGENPPKRQQYVDGAPRKVNTYYKEDLPLIDKIIHQVFWVHRPL